MENETLELFLWAEMGCIDDVEKYFETGEDFLYDYLLALWKLQVKEQFLIEVGRVYQPTRWERLCSVLQSLWPF